MKKYGWLFLLISIASSVSCVSTSSSTQSEIISGTHRWSESQLAILKNMQLSKSQAELDTSNRVVKNIYAIELGHRLFFDNRLSANTKVSCSTCHNPQLYFTDGKDQSVGLLKVTRNSPTVIGASQHNWFFLDGRADSLWAQALAPLENPMEHGFTRSQLAYTIYEDPVLRSLYEKVFSEMPNLSDRSRFPIIAGPVRKNKTAKKNWKNMSKKDQEIITDIFVNSAKAIAAYESELQPAESRFDKYVQATLENDYDTMSTLLTADEVKGLKIFTGKGNCFICHNGPMLTDFSFHNIGTPPLNSKKYDFGRRKALAKVTKSPFNCFSKYNDAKEKNCDELTHMVIEEEETMAAFKTPSLRNVSKTAPYMHAGQYETLNQVIKHYNDPPRTKIGMSGLLDIELTEKEMRELEAFLLSLDSDIDAPEYLLQAP